MGLLERGSALATLVAARKDAACGEGRMVFVRGEPGIGKTSLVNDDLSIPRPLGPIRDLAGAVSGPLERALASGAPAHDCRRSCSASSMAAFRSR